MLIVIHRAGGHQMVIGSDPTNDYDREPFENTIVLTGPTGSGKTALGARAGRAPRRRDRRRWTR